MILVHKNFSSIIHYTSTLFSIQQQDISMNLTWPEIYCKYNYNDIRYKVR